MTHKFTVTPKDDLPATLKRVETTITTKGGQFSGNTDSGNFAGVTPVGMVKGKYVVLNGTEIEITITDKPFVAPKSIIENKIRDYFS
ncbi:MAG: hypothetical protein Q7T36_06320 [Fluviicoccus sp.]|uniref:hypothetical protein n=1 Tax=Fluviicoccus sp. TaxID=2003552 RepID=UPI0027157C08|nr:hypothetical protein [Fluviicoccus sp.]MDO8330068.1 hypothetical protein [Fluviicoccus sp.]